MAIILYLVAFILACSVQCGNLTDLPRDVQARAFSRLNVIDRLNVRLCDRRRNEIIKGVHRADVINLCKLRIILEVNISNHDMCSSQLYKETKALVYHLKHTLPFYQALLLNLRIIRNNFKLSQRDKTILINLLNVTCGKCALCFENFSKQSIYNAHYDKLCNYCSHCWQKWRGNKTGFVRCPICEAAIYVPAVPFGQFSFQPGYRDAADIDSYSCCNGIQERFDLSNGCIGQFCLTELNFLKSVWCPQKDAAACTYTDYVDCCTRSLLAVPVTCLVFGYTTICLSATLCCCCDCCHVCCPDKNWREEWMFCFEASVADILHCICWIGLAF